MRCRVLHSYYLNDITFEEEHGKTQRVVYFPQIATCFYALVQNSSNCELKVQEYNFWGARKGFEDWEFDWNS